jgi:hypothetical protein
VLRACILSWPQPVPSARIIGAVIYCNIVNMIPLLASIQDDAESFAALVHTDISPLSAETTLRPSGKTINWKPFNMSHLAISKPIRLVSYVDIREIPLPHTVSSEVTVSARHPCRPRNLTDIGPSGDVSHSKGLRKTFAGHAKWTGDRLRRPC